MDAKKGREGTRLGLAELREAGGDGLDGAVPLAQLDGPVARQGPDRRREAVRREPDGERRDPPADVVPRRGDGIGVPVGELSHPGVGEPSYRLVAADGRDELEGLAGEVGVRRAERGLAAGGGHVAPGGASAAGPSGQRPGVLGDLSGVQQGSDVPAGPRGGEVEVARELHDRHRPLLDHEPQDALAGRAVQVGPLGRLAADAGRGDGAGYGLGDAQGSGQRSPPGDSGPQGLGHDDAPTGASILATVSLLNSFHATKVTLPTLRRPVAGVVPSPTLRAMPSSPAVAVSGLVKRYRGRAVVDGLDLTAAAGQVTAVLGPNGAGKTTTIECCEGLRRPDAGTVRVLGLDPTRDAGALRPRVGVMLQDGGLPAAAPAGQVLRHVAAMYARPRDLPALSRDLGLDAFARTPVRRLSGGERQRLALAVAVVGRPQVAFLDEPSAGLDPQARIAVWDLVRDLRAAGTAVVLTTHLMADAEALADRVVIVDGGHVVASGTVPELVGDGGGVEVTLRGEPPADADAASSLAAALAAALPALPGGRPTVVALGPGRLEVRTRPEPAVLHAVTGWAVRAGVVVDLRPARRTLEDVFLELTGRSLR